jgi:hypothetical protein
MLRHALRTKTAHGDRAGYHPVVELLEDRTLLNGTAPSAVHQVRVTANRLLQMTSTLTPQLQGHCGDATTFVTEAANLVSQVRAEALAVKEHFRLGKHSAKHAGAVLRQEVRLSGDLQALLAAGGLPSAQTLASLSNDSAGLQRWAVAALPQSLANACFHPTLPGSLFGGGLFLF